jgi:hypothetical protein
MSTERDRALAALTRKLEHWELEHLRDYVDELHGELAGLRNELAEAKRALSWAEDCADRWRDDALRAIEDAGAVPGVTAAGDVVLVKVATA